MNEDEIGGACSTYWDKRNVHGILVGKPEGKRLLARPRRRWEYNIKMVIKIQNWIHLAKNWDTCEAVVCMVMNVRPTQNVGIS